MMIRLHPLFSDGAVLQRRKPFSIFGTADPGAHLLLEFRSFSLVTPANEQGDFRFRLPPMEAGGPFHLKITDLATRQSVTVTGLLIGEVWLASGQSNMEYALARSVEEAIDFRRRNRKLDALRIFTVPRRLSLAPLREPAGGRWVSACEDSVAEHSAVALWFAAMIQEKLSIPVGVISASWGGSVIEAWISRQSLCDDPLLGPELSRYDWAASRRSRWKKTPENLLPPAMIPDFSLPENSGFAKGWAKEEFNDSAWKKMRIPGDWIEQGLSGSGTVWVRKTVVLPKSWAGRDLELFTGAIDKQDITYFNGQEVGRTGKGREAEYWNLPRHYRIPGALVHAGKNQIAIRAFSFFRGAGFLGDKKDYFLVPAGEIEGKRIFFSGEMLFSKECDWGKRDPGREWYAMGEKKILFHHHPSILFDSMIHSLAGYAFGGVLWYQGESNAVSAEIASSYFSRLKMLIDDWRFHLGQGRELPVLLVQLANFKPKRAYAPEEFWPLIRQAQWRVASQMERCGIIAAHDCGEARDLHPREKRRIGERLAQAALAMFFGVSDGVEPCPVPETIRADKNTLRIRFRYARKGLVLEAAKASGFWIASAAGSFFPASAVVQGDTLFLTSLRVASPRRVRYAWADNPAYASLYNRDGNPAIAFEMEC